MKIDMKTHFFKSPKPRLFAHRGYSLHFPENTLLAFEKALEYTHYLETDVWLSKNHEVIIHHDSTLERSCGLQKKISDLTTLEIQKLELTTSNLNPSQPKEAQRIPRLEELFSLLKTRNSMPCVNIEIKDPHPLSAKHVLAIIQKYNMEDHVLLAAENDVIMNSIRQEIKNYKLDIPTSASFGESFKFLECLKNGTLKLFQSPALAFQIPTEWQSISLTQPEIIQAAHVLGKEIHYWTINDLKLAKTLLDIGADGIISDDCELLKNLSHKSEKDT